MKDAIVIIPTYNEIENIDAIIRAVLDRDEACDILVVDDNSPDLTAEKVKTLQKEFPERLFLLQRQNKTGLGTAYIEGFKWCLEKKYEYIFEMDADFSHNPDDLVKLYNACAKDGADVAIGSRYITGVNVVNWPMNRILLSYFASKYVRFITRMKIQDTTAGFICYKRKVLETIDLDMIKFVGYAFQIEMKFKAHLKGFKIVEVPVIFTDRAKGKSKMSGGIVSEAIFGVIYMKFKSLFHK
ncbi:MAG TPA: polyprenol monophosphomannose synthase [Gelidibacter sp.]|uniref:polyprenol monophosphomannose synthase n=1 Tax=Gelidibacter sp. TaxID=2018083 RepID=UPI002C517AC0|nr:polyprenol monophosphomannose synthase [Gelidibacter sp.]HXJ98971.1 polyprenol monophosphomannose synthase [Gelidibacter sp.]